MPLTSRVPRSFSGWTWSAWRWKTSRARGGPRRMRATGSRRCAGMSRWFRCESSRKHHLPNTSPLSAGEPVRGQEKVRPAETRRAQHAAEEQEDSDPWPDPHHPHQTHISGRALDTHSQPEGADQRRQPGHPGQRDEEGAVPTHGER